MGKSKKRIFNKNVSSKGTILKRKDIVNRILSDIKTSSLSEESKRLICLFGITVEELSEAGAEFEDLSVVKSVII